MTRPLAIDLFCGLGGWTEGLLAEGWDVVGFDLERHRYGDHAYPAQLVIQDVLTLHGSQFRDAGLIVASPPCQEYSYMAMPWTRAKQIARALRGESDFPDGYTGSRTIGDLNALFDACFRIQREACEAAGRYIPLVVENVRGAQPWVGRSAWHYGSYHLWGDVPPLMPIPGPRLKGIPHTPGNAHWTNPSEHEFKNPGFRFDGSGRSFQTESVNGIKAGDRCKDRETGKWSTGWNVKNAQDWRAIKCGGDWFNGEERSQMRRHSSKSDSRKAASAMIAKIPKELARHVARVYRG